MARVQQPNLSERAFKIPVFTDVLNMGMNSYGYVKNYHPKVNDAVNFAETKAVEAWGVVTTSEVAKKADEKYNISTLAVRLANVSLDFIEQAVGNLEPETAATENAPNSEPTEASTPKSAAKDIRVLLRPLALLLCAIFYEARRQLLALEIIKNCHSMITEKSAKFTETATNYRTELQTRSEAVKTNVYERSEELRTELSAKAETVRTGLQDKSNMVRGGVENLTAQTYEHVETAKAKVGEYATVVLETVRPHVPASFGATKLEEELVEEPVDDVIEEAAPAQLSETVSEEAVPEQVPEASVEEPSEEAAPEQVSEKVSEQFVEQESETPSCQALPEERA